MIRRFSEIVPVPHAGNGSASKSKCNAPISVLLKNQNPTERDATRLETDLDWQRVPNVAGRSFQTGDAPAGTALGTASDRFLPASPAFAPQRSKGLVQRKNPLQPILATEAKKPDCAVNTTRSLAVSIRVRVRRPCVHAIRMDHGLALILVHSWMLARRMSSVQSNCAS